MWRRSAKLGSIRDKKMKKVAAWMLVALVILAVGTVGFSASRSSMPAASDAVHTTAGATASTAAQADGARAAQTGGYTAPADSNAAAAAPVQIAGAPAARVPASAPAQDQTKPWERMIIRTATLQLTVKDVNVSVDSVRSLANSHGGLVLTADSHQDGEYTVSTITIEVPSQEFDRIMPELRKLNGQVKKIASENVTSSDVTEEYTDLQSQLKNLQATEARMLILQSKADKMEDVLTVDRELRQVQGEIEKAQGRLNFLGKRSDMSSITINLAPEIAPVAPIARVEAIGSKTGWQPGEVAQTAWNNSLELLASVTSGLLTVVVFFWWAIPLLLASWAVARARRRVNMLQTSPPNPTPAANN